LQTYLLPFFTVHCDKQIIRVFSKEPIWNSTEYGILYGINFISRNFAKFLLYNTARFCQIPNTFVNTDFYKPSNEHSSINKLKKSTKGMVNAAEFRKGSCM
jgi:hypothetical protein